MKNYLKYIVVILTFLLTQLVFSQAPGAQKESAKSKTKLTRMIIHTAPALTLQFSGSYNYGVYELSGNDNGDLSPEEIWNGENFGVRHGGGLSAVMKIPLHKKGNVRLNISGNYNYFSSELSKINTGQFQNNYVKYSVLSGGVGIENNFTPNYRFKTLIGISLIASVITGSASLVDATTDLNYNVKPAFRMGISVTSGFEYSLTDDFGMNFGLRFTHANLWLKSSKQSDDPG